MKRKIHIVIITLILKSMIINTMLQIHINHQEINHI
jgi:hypothetical protein